MNTVFQSYALFPHLDIFENVAFGLRRRKVKDVKPQVERILELVELEVRELLNEYEFPGDDTPVIRGSALLAMQGDAGEYGRPSVIKLMEAVDSFIPNGASVAFRGSVGKVVRHCKGKPWRRNQHQSGCRTAP